MDGKLRSFRVSLYRHNADLAVDEPEGVYTGGADWERAATIHGPGFTTTCSIDLRPTWSELLTQGLRRHQAIVYGYETIVKFGDTQAWRPPFIVVIEVEYDSSK